MSGTWNETEYKKFFRHVNGFDPYEYQVDVARRLAQGENLVLQAPTGAGKTAAVITPFLYPGWQPKPARLIYALPLRTLVQAIARQAAQMLESSAGTGAVTVQTGEEPGDEFFVRGRIIVATYDQVLSGLLHSPYGLSNRLHSMNGAAIAGALVVFDEFHLMEIQRAFLTAAAGLHLYRGLAQTVWMTATATPALTSELREAFGAEPAGPDDKAISDLPSVSTVSRRAYWHDEPMYPEAVASRLQGRTIVIANTVGRAQMLFKELTRLRPEVPAVLLHSRFFQSDRKDKEKQLASTLGKRAKGPALLVATQVIEAGVDISCDQLHTELAPMNSVVQRSGRCARFEHEAGEVHVYELADKPRAWLPYGDNRAPRATLDGTRDILKAAEPGILLDPVRCRRWVCEVHGEGDRQAAALGWAGRFGEILAVIHARAIDRRSAGASKLIREPDLDDRRVIVACEHTLPRRPGMLEAVTLRRWGLQAVVQAASESIGWFWDWNNESAWQPLLSAAQLRDAYIVAVKPRYAKYSRELGMEVGEPGDEVSPRREEVKRPGHVPLHAEPWTVHARAVAAEAQSVHSMMDGDGWLSQRLAERYSLPPDIVMGAVRACSLAHDLGKLQVGWQEWAAAMQRLAKPGYVQNVALAHTDFDPTDVDSMRMARQVGIAKPDHSSVGAFLAIGTLKEMLVGAVPQVRGQVIACCVAAVLGHHGGWLGSQAGQSQDLGAQRLHPLAEQAIAEACGYEAWKGVAALPTQDRLGTLTAVLDLAAGADSITRFWPLMAYLTRTLRLSDQTATKEGGNSE